jgi:predicted Fe-S protein YdhL (DUF1289 family)
MSPLPQSSPAVTGVPSPCVRRCTLNEDDICVGCGRTLTEITQWTRMDWNEQAACVARAAARRSQSGPSGRSGAPRDEPR